jgi:hypothetical protein
VRGAGTADEVGALGRQRDEEAARVVRAVGALDQALALEALDQARDTRAREQDGLGDLDRAQALLGRVRDLEQDVVVGEGEGVLVGQVALEAARDRAVRLEEPRPGREPLPLQDGYDETSVARGFGSGVRICSIFSRIGSKRGGSVSFSPRCSMSSSVSKPGPMVASSNSTPLGSRK